MKYVLACFSALALFDGPEAAKSMGPVGNIIANSIYLCKEKPPGDEFTIEVDLKSLDGKGTKAMFANFTNKIPVDLSIDYSLDIQKWESGSWKNYYSVKGKFCPDAQKLFPKIWQKLRAAAKPQMVLPCPIKPDKYFIDKFQVTSKDLTIPAIFYGQFQVKLQCTKNKKVVMCIQGEGVSQAP